MDLLVYHVDRDYEKCLKKADRYMSKDASKRDALPYLYSSMAYYSMSRDYQYAKDYPRAYKKCLSYLTKYRRKDKTYANKEEAQPFIETIKLVVAEQIDNYKLDGTEKSDRKIVSLLKKLKRMDPEDSGIKLMLGVYYLKTKNRSEGREYINSGTEGVLEIGVSVKFGTLTRTQQLYFKQGIISYYQLKKERYPKEATEVLSIGEAFFLEDREDCHIENIDDFQKAFLEAEG
jgi:hypothetical protein